MKKTLTQLSKKTRKKLYILYGILGMVFLVCLGVSVSVYSSLHESYIFVLTAVIGGMEVLIAKLLTEREGHRLEETFDRENRERMLDFQVSQRAQRHDFRLHLSALSGMIEAGKYDECQTYIRNMIDTAEEVSEVMPLADPAVSALLFELKKDAQKKNILLTYAVYHDLGDIVMNPYEINAVLGNLIRNAIEACTELKEEDRNVSVTILKRRGFCIFRIENPFYGKANPAMFTAGWSRKQGHSGIGLASVQHLCESCGGTVFAEKDDNRLAMIAEIPCRKKRKK